MENERRQILEIMSDFDEQTFKFDSHLSEIKTMFDKCKATSISFREQGNDMFRLPKHNAKIHMKIWKYYSYSIATAPTGSDILACGYANRSAFLIHIRKYEEGIRDIDRALKITKSCELKVKLFCRKTECLVALQDGKQRSAFEQAKFWFNKVKDSKDMKVLIKNLEKIKNILEINHKDYNIRKKKKIDIKCKNDAISINYNQKYGRHLLTTRYIGAGEFICMDKFYITSVNGKNNFALCSHCLAISWATIPCNYCAYCMYCSEECKQKSWELYHDIECSIHLAACTNETYMIQMSVRALIMGYKEAGSLELLKKMVDSVLNSKDVKTKDFLTNGKETTYNFKTLLSLSYLKRFNKSRIACAMSALRALGLNKSNNGKVFMIDESKKFMDQKNIIFLASLLLRLVSIFCTNSFKVFEKSFARKKINSSTNHKYNNCVRGFSYSPLPSLINHSCHNNVGRFYTNDGKVVYFSNQPIKKGAQVFSTYYVEFMQCEKMVRQMVIHKAYEFYCDCAACKNDWQLKMIGSIEEKRAEVSSIGLITLKKYKKLVNILNSKDHRSSKKTLKAFAKDLELVLKNYKNPCFYNQVLINTLSLLIEYSYGTVLRIPNQCK